ncbi:hypothetical protein [Dokdonia sp. Hel_I_53]|uniref:hypothetical protein n=1 Tax=Dokdonia sp. Hel_I_53 TaxID=1566287 RepID=UPI00119C181E|nr:hypothetical protein [Dokdonia sp. Hel_I_53]TVZ52011.1 hypothetical protein OD90_1174 [Dokdonia sp. Hel_I_53]
MKSIIRLALAATLAIFAQTLTAQDSSEKEVSGIRNKQNQIEYLKEKREELINVEKESLKRRVMFLNKQVESGEITKEEAEEQKLAFAEKVALNIKNETAIIDNKIELVQRNGKINNDVGSQVVFDMGTDGDDGKKTYGITINDGKVGDTKEYDKRTYSELVIAFGLNNGITEVDSEIGDQFSIGRSRFFELGYAWKTRVFENSGALHLKYGLSLQTNKLFKKENERLVVSNDMASFEEFPEDLDKSQLRFSNLVVPIHFEFGGWKKEQKEDYVRYRLARQFRMGIGGYAGFRLGTQQKLKYKVDGERVKTKEKTDFGGDNFVYGFSSYIRLSGDLSLYGKYDLSSAFKTENLGEVNNLSLGLRWDL